MSDLNIVQSPTQNFTTGRKGHTPIAVVFHVEDGTEDGTMSWFKNPASQVSAHYSVARDGTIHQYVKEEDSAWAVGIVNKPIWKNYIPGVNPNYYTISIEHEGHPEDGFTDIQIANSIKLATEIVKRWNIPVDADHLIGHNQLDTVTRAHCPGDKFPFDKVISTIKANLAPAPKPIVTPAPTPTPTLDWTNHWAAPFIKRLLYNQVLTGIDDKGNFAPDAVATRAQLAVVACRIMDHLEQTYIFPLQQKVTNLESRFVDGFSQLETAINALQAGDVANLQKVVTDLQAYVQNHGAVQLKI